MNVSWNYCGLYFTVHVNQIITQYTLHLRGNMYQFFLNKNGEKVLKQNQGGNWNKKTASQSLTLVYFPFIWEFVHINQWNKSM